MGVPLLAFIEVVLSDHGVLEEDRRRGGDEVRVEMEFLLWREDLWAFWRRVWKALRGVEVVVDVDDNAVEGVGLLLEVAAVSVVLSVVLVCVLVL
jgi:hypothetical protein